MPSVIVSYTLNDNSFDINWRCASITLRSPRAAGPVCASCGASTSSLLTVSLISGIITLKGNPCERSTSSARVKQWLAKLQANTAAKWR